LGSSDGADVDMGHMSCAAEGRFNGRAFSSEVGTGSRQENASNPERV
jgi:hypothetical protein